LFTGAIACLLAIIVWGLTAQGVAISRGISHPVYIILIIIGWILLPLYIKLIRYAFIIGIFVVATAMSYILFLTSLLGTAPWFTFSRGLYDFTYIVFLMISIAAIYFFYKSWKELQKR